MGLDMYLMKKIPNNEDVELIYWRKANQVFNWFDRNCANNAIENCVPVPVSTYDLINLLKDVNAVLEKHSGNYQTLELVYAKDANYENNKIYYAYIYVRFYNHIEDEFFRTAVLKSNGSGYEDSIALNTGSSTSY